ncbi:hypothetical protein Vafri_16508, partial [Volvox africanus]
EFGKQRNWCCCEHPNCVGHCGYQGKEGGWAGYSKRLAATPRSAPSKPNPQKPLVTSRASPLPDIQERPYATSLLPQFGPVTCRTCFRSITAAAKSLQRCRRCGAAYYCSYKCASLDRRPHRDSGECWLYDHAAGLSLAAPAGLQREAVLALRHLTTATTAQTANTLGPSTTVHATAAAPAPPIIATSTLVTATTAEITTTRTASPRPGSPTLQQALSCHEALLSAGSQLERELAGWQAAAVASAVTQGEGEVEDRGERRAAAVTVAVWPLGKLAQAAIAQATMLAEAAGLGPGLGLLGTMLARAALA